MKRSLEGGRNFPSLKPDWLIKGLFFLMLIYTSYNLFMSQYNIFKVLELRKSLRNIQAQINQYKVENDKTDQLLKLVKEHPEYFKEKFARSYMQMQKEGEYILILGD